MARRKKQPLKVSEGKSDTAIFKDVKFAAVPYSNFVGGQYIDRMYGTHTGVRLVQKDGTEYAGAIHNKKRKCYRQDGTLFWQTLHVTKDGRWFDNSGMPMDKPGAIDEEDQNAEDSGSD